MKVLLCSFLFFASTLLHAQTNDDVNKFITIFKSQITKYNIGKIEEHYDNGYFTTLTESEYFDKDLEVGLTTLAQKCFNKDNQVAIQEIKAFFEQHKRLKIQMKEINSKMNDFNTIQSFLKIKIYSDEWKTLYEKSGIVKPLYKGMIEVIVVDLPSGIGSLEKKYLSIWQKSENDIYSIAKANTLKNLNEQFEKEQTGKDGEEFYLLSSDIDLFAISSILQLEKTNVPIGKYGTLISIPNNTVIAALPLNDSLKIEKYALNFIGLTNYMFESSDTKPISSSFFWFNGKELLLIEKNISKKELLYPNDLKKFIAK